MRAIRRDNRPIEPAADNETKSPQGRLLGSLEAARGRGDNDPYVNPIRLLALDILRGLDGSDLDQSALEQLLRRRILEAFESAFAGSMSEEQFARLESVRRRITPVVQATPPGPR